MLFRGDEIDWDSDSGDVHAVGHVFFRNFERNYQFWASRMEYNTETQKGKLWDVRGETHPKVVVRPGLLTTSAPFYFEGEWAERIGEKYILYNGWVTNCTVPKPWWRLRGSRFDIVPEQSATSHRSWFLVRRMPLFYTPFFYHSLEKEPRKSGFLTPNIVPRSLRGFMIGLGYFWAISRSYDVTYRFQDYTTNAFTHHVDFRGKPRPGTDFDAIFYGVQDRGLPGNGNPPPTYSGVNVYAVARSDLGDGWTARGFVNYISSFRFRQQWSQNYNEAIGSEIQSVGFVNKDWSTYTFDVAFARLQNYENIEQLFVDPVTGKSSFITDAVTLRKMPEAWWSSRDHQIWRGVPLWFSFDSTAGLLFRSEPFFDSNNALISRFQTSTFTDRVHLAPHLTSALHLGPLHLVPSIGFDETYYGETQGPDPLNPGLTRVFGTNFVRSSHDLSVDLIFPSLARVFQKKTIFGDKLKHVIEPRASWRYVTGIGDDFDRIIRFDSTDILADTNEIAYSLTNRIYAKRGNSVQEIFTWELVQKRYFDPTFGGALVDGQRNVFAGTADLTAYAFLVGPRSASPVASLLRISPISGMGIRWQADYDSLYHGISNSALGMDYRWQKWYVLGENNSVHTDPALSPPANQFHFHASYGDANHRGINAGVDAAYDYRQRAFQYSTMQVTYNTNCCGLAVEYRRIGFVGSHIPQIRIAFTVANIGSAGSLRKQDRIF